MSRVEIDPAIHQMGYGRVQHGTDSGALVTFERHSVEADVAETRNVDIVVSEGGKDVVRTLPKTEIVKKAVEKEYIRIKFPGSKTTEVYRQVVPSDKERFALQYQAFLQGVDPMMGTPIAGAPFIDKASRETLRKADIVTVEQLAAVSDVNLVAIRLPNARALRDLAIGYLNRSGERAQISGETAAMQAQLDAERAKSSDLEARLARLEGMLTSGAGANAAQDTGQTGARKGAKPPADEA
jgi:hypothetical protein